MTFKPAPAGFFLFAASHLILPVLMLPSVLTGGHEFYKTSPGFSGIKHMRDYVFLMWLKPPGFLGFRDR